MALGPQRKRGGGAAAECRFALCARARRSDKRRLVDAAASAEWGDTAPRMLQLPWPYGAEPRCFLSIAPRWLRPRHALKRVGRGPPTDSGMVHCTLDCCSARASIVPVGRRPAVDLAVGMTGMRQVHTWRMVSATWRAQTPRARHTPRTLSNYYMPVGVDFCCIECGARIVFGCR